MGWTSPSTWVVGAILTAAQLNTQVRDNERYLKGTDGEIVLEDYPDFPSTAQGDIFYHNGTKLARLPASTSGYLLKTQGTAANPTWTAGAINAASGLTPVATGWDTAPTTLGNITDGDLATVTGEGSYVKADAGETENEGQITIDLGSAKPISKVLVKVGIRSSDASYTCKAKVRAGAIGTVADELIGAEVTNATATEVVFIIQAVPVANALTRYIGIRGYNGTAAKAVLMKIYEVIATSAW